MCDCQFGFAGGDCSQTDPTDPADQAVLAAFYGGLPDKGSLVWNTAFSLCAQFGVTCTSSKVISM